MGQDPQRREVPAELADLAETLNAWSETFSELAPGYVRFRVRRTTLSRGGEPLQAVQLWTITHHGPHVTHLPPELAEQLAGLLLREARAAQTGIAVAGSSPLHLPNGKGH